MFYDEVKNNWLIDKYNSGSPLSKIAKEFNETFNCNKSEGAIGSHCTHLGLYRKSKKITKEEIDWLKKNYKKFNSNNELANEFNRLFNEHRSVGTIRNIYMSFDDYTHLKYTPEQNKWVKDNFEYFELLSDLLIAFNNTFNTNRTLYSISTKCSQLHLRKNFPYSKEQIDWIKNNAENYLSIKDLLKDFNLQFPDYPRTYEAIRRLTQILKIDMSKNFLYTEEQKEWLRNNYLKYSEVELAEHFNSTFNTNHKPRTLAHYSAHFLGCCISENKERVNLLRKKINELPVGSESALNGIVYVKVNDNMRDRAGNWAIKSRLINNATKDQYVYIIDPSKPITKENTIVVDSEYKASVDKIGVTHLPPELKQLGVKLGKLKHLQNKCQKAEEE